mmetsp:Transcript_76208/g.204645  ORF Transcript_76208/g.204645 Transcript_76208/m.204645 type:complete len:82 (+) Transcript_76208:414-659(+)
MWRRRARMQQFVGLQGGRSGGRCGALRLGEIDEKAFHQHVKIRDLGLPLGGWPVRVRAGPASGQPRVEGAMDGEFSGRSNR